MRVIIASPLVQAAALANRAAGIAVVSSLFGAEDIQAAAQALAVARPKGKR